MKASTAKNATELLQLLRDRTQNEKLNWEETERSDVLQASFSNYSVRVGPSSKIGSAAAAITAVLGRMAAADEFPLDVALVIFDGSGNVDDVISVPGALELLNRPITYSLPDPAVISTLLRDVFDLALKQVERTGSSTGELIHELEQSR